jgi:uncharacterized membrane protein YfcA
MSALLLFVGLALGGVAAGTLSTVTGMGGGIALVTVLSFFFGPHAALAATAPALLVGNIHRATSHRGAIDRPTARVFMLAALPGAVLGGVLCVAMPNGVLAVLLVSVTALALARSLGHLAFEVRPLWMWPFAFRAGTVAATSGAGVIVSPMLVAGGLKGERLIATASFIAILLHVGRLVGYGVSGLYEESAALGGITASAFLALFLVLGNALGDRLRARLGEARCMRLTHLTLWVSLGLSVLSLLRQLTA